MGKGSAILGIIGILIGAGGLGFGIITWMEQSQVNIWNDYEVNIFYPTLAAYETIPNLYVIIDLSSPVQLYVTFSASTRLNPNPTSLGDIIFYFMIDDVILPTPSNRVGSYEGGSTNDYFSVILQYFNHSFSARRHNISVVVWSDAVGNMIRECFLTAQSYPI
jgi:hypothetical protein